MSIDLTQIEFLQTYIDSLQSGFEQKGDWILQIMFDEPHTLLILDLIKQLYDFGCLLRQVFDVRRV